MKKQYQISRRRAAEKFQAWAQTNTVPIQLTFPTEGIVELAQQSLGSHERAMHWLKRGNRALGGVAPIAVVDTELGSRQVENVLGRIAYGGIS